MIALIRYMQILRIHLYYMQHASMLYREIFWYLFSFLIMKGGDGKLNQDKNSQFRQKHE